MLHWASSLIGRPWSPDPLAEGPREFSCWGLVRYVTRTQRVLELPAIRIGGGFDEENVAAIKVAASAQGWRRLERGALLCEFDVVLMRDASGRRHVGLVVMLPAGTRLVLHAVGYVEPGGRVVGDVRAQPLDALFHEGFRDFDFWRHA